MKDTIVQNGAPVLRDVAVPVAEDQFGSAALAEIISRMTEALDAQKDGVALAAPQIAIPLRIFVVRFDRLHPTPKDASPLEPEIGVFINPEFVRASRRRIEMEEGCLSVRCVYGKTLRHERATVRARLPDGSVFERGGGGILAQVYQHETDHLDGILFIDHAHDIIEIDPSDLEQYQEARTERRQQEESEHHGKG